MVMPATPAEGRLEQLLQAPDFVGDGARRDEDGYFWITGRIDDVINAEGRNPGDATTLRDASVLAKLQQATTQDDSESAGVPETGNTR